MKTPLPDTSTTDSRGLPAVPGSVLRKCPFCGSRAEVREVAFCKAFQVGCPFCAIWLKPWRQQRDAEHVWNMRPDEREALHHARRLLKDICEQTVNEADEAEKWLRAYGWPNTTAQPAPADKSTTA